MFNELDTPGRAVHSERRPIRVRQGTFMRPGLVPVAHSLVALAALSFAPLSVHAAIFKELYVGGINNSGTVAGSVGVSSDTPPYENSGYGFVRAADGTMSTYAIPGALAMTALDINSNDTVVGHYQCAVGCGEAYIREPDGTITTFQIPGGKSTIASAINAKGEVVGSYFADGGPVRRAFVRAKDGTITTFSAGEETHVYDINSSGDVTGYATLRGEFNSLKFVGFIRTAQGKITTFEVAGGQNTQGVGIQTSGAVAGLSDVAGGFLRESDGTISTFDVYDVEALNSRGEITGSDRDEIGTRHGYVRARDGSIEFFDVPGALTGFNLGTHAQDINSRGEIAGYYAAGRGEFGIPFAHGFVRDPDGTITTFGIPEHVSAAQASAPAIEDRALTEQPVAEQGSIRASIRAASLLRHGATAELEFSLPEAAQVSLVVYDVMGRSVATIEHGPRNAGVHRASWDATATAPGIYFYRLVAGSQTATRSVRVVP